MYSRTPTQTGNKIHGQRALNRICVWYTAGIGIDLLCSDEGVTAAPFRNPIQRLQETNNKRQENKTTKFGTTREPLVRTVSYNSPPRTVFLNGQA